MVLTHLEDTCKFGPEVREEGVDHSSEYKNTHYQHEENQVENNVWLGKSLCWQQRVPCAWSKAGTKGSQTNSDGACRGENGRVREHVEPETHMNNNSYLHDFPRIIRQLTSVPRRSLIHPQDYSSLTKETRPLQRNLSIQYIKKNWSIDMM